jgi:ribulose-5-phosphate 4-epimerase/fuculose-1-phosphate aldolase
MPRRRRVKSNSSYIDHNYTSDVKERLAIANRVLGNWYNTLGLGSILMSFGHVSEKTTAGNQFYVRGRPVSDDLLIKTKASEIVIVDFSSSKKVGGSSSVSMPGETKLHSFIYRKRSDVNSVCHAHPHFCVLASDLNLDLKPMCNEGIDLFPIKLYRNNALISTDERGNELVRVLGDADSCLLRGHGAVTIGATCEIAVMRMIQLEEQARLNVFAFMAKGTNYEGITESQASRYLDETRSGLKRAGLSEDQIKKHLSGLSLWPYLADQVLSKT